MGPGSSTSRRHLKTSERHLYFPRRRRAFQSERIQRACPPIGPCGRTGTLPRMRRGDLDQTDRAYERTRHRTPHVRVQAMSRATSVHCRLRERNDSWVATLAGRSPTPPPQSNRSAENPGAYWPGFSLRAARRYLRGAAQGKCERAPPHTAWSSDEGKAWTARRWSKLHTLQSWNALTLRRVVTHPIQKWNQSK